MEKLKKLFETEEGCDLIEFKQIGLFMPLSAVLVICYVGSAIAMYTLGKYAIVWQDIVSICILVLTMICVLAMIYLLYRRMKYNQTFTRKSIGLIRKIGRCLGLCTMIVFLLSMSSIFQNPLLYGMFVLVLILEQLIDAMASILVRGEKIQEEQDLTI